MKKILINTHPLGHNYGGIAQAYALQTFLKSLGYQSETTASDGNFYMRHIARNRFIRMLLRKNSLKDNSLNSLHTRKFISENMSVIPFSDAKKRARSGEYDVFLSGSDQVWRNLYVYVPHYLFSFVRDESKLRISYAASFGRGDLDEYGSYLVKKSKRLAQKFDAISVREESGIDLVRKHWGLMAECHVDPTFLLEANDYLNLIRNPSTTLPESRAGGIFAYTLDKFEETEEIQLKVEEIFGKKAHRLISDIRNENRPLPPIEQWFRSFQEADFVITDSFHGTVFSIIFNKPFISIGNVNRGFARFTSLLRKFNLEDRLVSSVDEISSEKINRELNWGRVNAIIAEEREKSKSFLMMNLRKA